MASDLAVMTALEGKRVWWVGPTYPVASTGWREIKATAKQIPGTAVSESERRVTLCSGGWVQVRSADNPDSLRGEGLDFVVLDECAFIPEDAWNEALRPTLADRKGKALFISTPKGRNLFWRLFQAGQDTTQTEWKSWNVPTSSNPWISPDEIEAARRGMPDRIFRQEFLAEFIEDGAGVFRNVKAAATASPQTAAIPGHEYVVGVDWGQSNDFTVFVVIDTTTREVVCCDRSNQVDYAVQRGRLGALWERFKPVTILAERNSIGQPIIEDLERSGLPVSPFLTTNASKTNAIEALALAIERNDIRLLDDEALIGELLAFESERLPSGVSRYSAPSGLHDDCVMALAIAVHAAWGNEGERGWWDIARKHTQREVAA